MSNPPPAAAPPDVLAELNAVAEYLDVLNKKFGYKTPSVRASRLRAVAAQIAERDVTFDKWFDAQDQNVIEGMSRRAVACEAWHHIRRNREAQIAGRERAIAETVLETARQIAGRGVDAQEIERHIRALDLSPILNPEPSPTQGKLSD